jgi:hypothetical protein
MKLAHDSLSQSTTVSLLGMSPRLWGSELCAILRTSGSLCSTPVVLWNDEPLASLSNCPSTKAPMTEPPLN